ncbi:hypothetical protein FQN54_005929 [Arachnomyces sp. PD_36]|nr:hypothetical protein FQN54_005929 [Arachnomyces sp. PD_36]
MSLRLPTPLRTPASEAYLVLNSAFTFKSEDELQWWSMTAPRLSIMLEYANYNIHQQYKYLCFYREHIIPALGPFPKKGQSTSSWTSALCRPGIPLELSLNYPQSVVRFAMEVIGPLAGTRHDPFNAHFTGDFLRKLALSPLFQENFDIQWFNHFTDQLRLTREESEFVSGKAESLNVIKTQYLVAFDLKKTGDPLGKVYFYPHTKSVATGDTTGNVVFGAIRKIDVNGSFSPQLSLMDDYLGSGSGSWVHILGVDLVKPTRSRIKIYIANTHVYMSTVEELWTLGGRQTDPVTISSLEILKELWTLLQIPEKTVVMPEEAHQVEDVYESEDLPLLVNYSLNPSGGRVDPQIYISLLGKTDQDVASTVVTFFKRIGWEDHVKCYEKSLFSCL